MRGSRKRGAPTSRINNRVCQQPPRKKGGVTVKCGNGVPDLFRYRGKSHSAPADTFFVLQYIQIYHPSESDDQMVLLPLRRDAGGTTPSWYSRFLPLRRGRNAGSFRPTRCSGGIPSL